MASYAGQIETGAGITSPIGSTLYGICSQQANDPVKVVVLPEYDTLLTGSTVHVKFTNGNTAANPTLTVGSTAAKPIYIYGTLAPGSTAASTWAANSVLSLTYDGTAWRMNDGGFAMWDSIYPVGSIYMSVNSTNPGVLFGGTWEQIRDKFLLSAGTTYSAGTTGGAATVMLTTSNLPSHTHSIPALSGSAASTNIAHTHGVGSGNKFVYAPSSTSNTKIIGGGDGRVTLTSMDNFSSSTATGSAGGSHTHSVTTNASTTGSNGSGTAVDKMPPYLAVYVWKRTA